MVKRIYYDNIFFVLPFSCGGIRGDTGRMWIGSPMLTCVASGCRASGALRGQFIEPRFGKAPVGGGALRQRTGTESVRQWYP